MTKLNRQEYDENGYAFYPELVDPNQLKILLAEIDRISDGNTLAAHDKTRLEMEPDQKSDGRLVRRIYQPCTHYAPFRELSDFSQAPGRRGNLVGTGPCVPLQ